MAEDSGCPVCRGEHPVNWMVTHLNPAATILACEQDFDAALLALLAARLEVEPGWLSAAIDTAIEQDEMLQAVAATPYDTPPGDAEAEALAERYADGGDVGPKPAAAPAARKTKRRPPQRQFETVEVEREVITTESGLQYLAEPDE